MALHNRPGNDAGAFVRVQFFRALFKRRVKRGAGLGDENDLACRLDLALPAVDRSHAGKNVDAGGEFFLHQRAGDFSATSREGAVM